MSLLMILVAVALLYLGAEWLVAGATALARAAGIPPLIVGLTVVGFGTSMPELVVSALAAFEGKSAIALGNVVGSNIANIGVILAVTALISPPRVSAQIFRHDVPPMVIAAVAVPLSMVDGVVSRVEGFVLMALAGVVLVRTIQRAGAAPADGAAAPGAPALDPAAPGRGSSIGRVVLGLATLIVAGKIFVDGASDLARLVGISERVIGLTVVSIGTSLPELAASLMAAWRGESEIALGNVVGSNIFNVFLILGFSAAVAPIPGSLEAQRQDLFAMLAFTAFATWSMRHERHISRYEGAMMLGLYVAFTALLVVQG